MRYHSRRLNEVKRDDYYLPPRDDDDVDPPGQLVTKHELSVLTGCSGVTVQYFADEGMIPIAGIDNGKQLFDLADPKLAEWVAALQRAGYNQSPVEVT